MWNGKQIFAPLKFFDRCLVILMVEKIGRVCFSGATNVLLRLSVTGTESCNGAKQPVETV